MWARYISQANQQDIKLKVNYWKRSHLLWKRNSITMFTKAHYTPHPK